MWALDRSRSGYFDVETSLNTETAQILPPEENKNSFVCFQLLWLRNKSTDSFATWQDWAIDSENDNFTCDFKVGNNNNKNLKDSDESCVEFEGVLC